MSRIRALPESTTLRIALLYMVLFGGSMTLLLGFLHYATAGYLQRQTDAEIGAEAADLATHYRQGGVGALAREVSNRAATNVGRRSVYLLADAERTPMAGNINRWPDEFEPDDDGWLEFELAAGSETTDPIRGRIYRPGGQLYLLIGRNVAAERSFAQLIATALGWGLVLTVILAIAGGLVTARLIGRRLERINATAREVMAGDLRQRVPQHGANDQFDRLAENLNLMLDRIEHLMAGVRQVSDNIAHDLRTPLTRLRWRLDKLRETRDEHLLDDAIAEADGLLQTFHALLRIAEVESGSRRRFTRVDIAALAADVAELYEPVAAEHGQTLTVATDGPVHAHADRDVLFQALTNMVDNAVKYTPPDGRIEMRVARRDHQVEVSVADSGPGIPADKRDAVLERFYRLEASRGSPGSGLGLSLVAAVAQLHDGRLSLEDNAPGLRITLLLRAG